MIAIGGQWRRAAQREAEGSLAIRFLQVPQTYSGRGGIRNLRLLLGRLNVLVSTMADMLNPI